MLAVRCIHSSVRMHCLASLGTSVCFTWLPFIVNGFFWYAPMCLGQRRHKGDAIDALHRSGDGAVIDPLKRVEEWSNSSCYVNPTPSSEWVLDPNTSWQLGLARAKPPPFRMGPEIRTAPAPGMGSSRSSEGGAHMGAKACPCLALIGWEVQALSWAFLFNNRVKYLFSRVLY